MQYEPYSFLHNDRILGFFPLDTEPLQNIAPTYDVNQSRSLFYPILIDSVVSLTPPATNHGAEFSSISMQGKSLYFDGNSYINIPINMKPINLPQLTIGCWMRLADENQGPLR